MEPTKPTKEEMILARLGMLFKRRDATAANLAVIDAKIAQDTKKLARERGVIFIRTDVVRKEIG